MIKWEDLRQRASKPRVNSALASNKQPMEQITMEPVIFDPFAKIAKAIAGGLSGKIAPKSSDMVGMATMKQYKVPKGTTITVPRPHASVPIDRADIGAGQMIVSKKEAIYDENELLFNDDGYYGFKLPWNNKEIPYILVDHKRTTVVYIIELPGDLNEEIF